VPVSFTVRADGTVEAVDVKDIASEGLKKKLASQIGQWLFEPPIQNGKSIQVSTNSTLTITVMRSQ
jgi:outer membrane biosynthesis protein TonB